MQRFVAASLASQLAPSNPAVPAPASPETLLIHHIVMLLMENNGFGRMLGWMGRSPEDRLHENPHLPSGK
jgi:hypothetical protein